jgi:hypothetical protein
VSAGHLSVLRDALLRWRLLRINRRVTA